MAASRKQAKYTPHCQGRTQWRRSVVKSEGSGSVGSSHQTKKPTEIRFRFRRRKWAIWSFSAFFRFRPKMNFLLCFIFRFHSKNVICIGRKCYVSNGTTTKFCDIGTGNFRFRPKMEFHFRRHFLTAENEKCIFGRPLHQTVSD